MAAEVKKEKYGPICINLSRFEKATIQSCDSLAERILAGYEVAGLEYVSTFHASLWD